MAAGVRSDDKTIVLAVPICQVAGPNGIGCSTVRVQAVRGFSRNKFFRLFVDDTLTDMSGTPIDGNRDAVPGGDLIAFVGQGTKLAYTDSNSDSVSLTLRGGGLMDVVRDPNGEGRSLTLSNTVPGRSALLGTVRLGLGGDGQTRFNRLTGTAGVNLTGFKQPPFVVSSPIAATVVDRLLESGDSASSLLADSLMDEQRK